MTGAGPIAAPAVTPGSWRAWLLAARPRTLVAAVVPVAVGVACVPPGGSLRLDAVAAALVGALGIQVATNLVNDAADFERGADDARRVGPPRAAQAGLLTPAQLRAGTLAVLGVAAVAGAYLVALRGLAVVAIGVASVAAGLAYTAGPLPLAYVGLGEVFVLAFFGGVAVAGTAFVASGTVPPIAWSAAVPVGASATMLLAVNNVRDAVTDAAAGKRTLVVRFGRRFGEVEYVALAALLYVVPLGWWVTGVRGSSTLLALATLPLAVRLARALRAGEGAALNAVLAGTARLMLVHGAIVCAILAWR